MRRNKLSRRKNAKRAVRVLAGEIQQLERRSLPTGTVSIALVGSNLTVNGDSGNNDLRIEVSNDGVTVQGYTDTFDGRPVNLTKLKVTVDGVTKTYKAGELVELISADDLDDLEGDLVLGNLTVNMGAGNDKIELDVQEQDEEGSINSLTVTGTLKIDLGTGSDGAYVDFNETNLEVVGAVSLIGGAGDDDIDVDSRNNTATFKSTVTVDSGAGSDDVNLRWDEVTIDKDQKITTGDGSDRVYQDFNGVSTLKGKVDILTGNGSDSAYMNFNDDVTFNSNVNFDAGAGRDEVGLSSFYDDAHVTIKGNLTVNGGIGGDNDYARFNFYGDEDQDQSLTVNGGISVKLGDGENDTYFSVNDLTVGKNLDIETGSGSDYVGIFEGLTVTGGVHIATGGGDDYVTVRPDDPTDLNQEPLEAVQNSIGKSLIIDTANTLSLLGLTATGTVVGNGTPIDTRGGDDADSVYVAFNTDAFEIKGNLDIRTFNGGDIVQVNINGDTEFDEDLEEDVHSAGEVTIGGDLKINSGVGDDLVYVWTENSGELLVKGNAEFTQGIFADVVGLGDGEDCLIVGDEVATDTSLGSENDGVAGSIEVTKNFTVKGGLGGDNIGLAGIGVGGNLLVNADAGDDVVGGFGLQIGGNLTVNGGADHDSIGAQGTEDYEFTVGGNTTIDAGLGNDTVLVDGVTFGANDAAARSVSVNLNAGNDNLAASNVFAGDGLATVTVNGGANTDQGVFDDSIDDDEPGVTVTGFDGDEFDIEASQDAIIAALQGCLDTFDWYND